MALALSNNSNIARLEGVGCRNHLKNDDAECGRQKVDQSVEEDGELEEEGGVAA